MHNLFAEINKKINGLIWSLFSTGAIILVLAILIVWTDFMLRLVVGLLVLVISYAFFYIAFKLWTVKKSIRDYFER